MDFLDCVKAISPNFRKTQLRQAVYRDLVSDFIAISTLPKDLRASLSKDYVIVPYKIIEAKVSSDGSTKWLLEASDGARIETVLMRFKDGRNTVCVSSQVGCPAGCLFCATGKLGLKRNLSSWEIISQVLLAARFLKETQKEDQELHITNVVFMGMGEPLFNLDNLLIALSELTSPDGFGLGARHITVSTCGPIKQLKKFIDAKTRTTLAISLHAPNQHLRDSLMPISKLNRLEDLFKILDQYVQAGGRRVSYEYILIKGVNDNNENATTLVNLLKNRLAHVNLLVFNQIEGSDFEPSSRTRADEFKSILEKNKIAVTIRVSLGEEIAAACGQLAGREQ